MRLHVLHIETDRISKLSCHAWCPTKGLIASHDQIDVGQVKRTPTNAGRPLDGPRDRFVEGCDTSRSLLRVDLLERIAVEEESNLIACREPKGGGSRARAPLPESPALFPGCIRWPIFDGEVARNPQCTQYSAGAGFHAVDQQVSNGGSGSRRYSRASTVWHNKAIEQTTPVQTLSQ